MYISKLQIRNYRCFADTTVRFEPGVSVIIGENNAGKSSLLSALRLVFEGGGARQLDRYDFHQGIDEFGTPPRISITATLESEGDDTPSELGTVATWLTEVGDGKWEAKLTYHFYLPDRRISAFEDRLPDEDPSKQEFWRAVERTLPNYVARIDAGHPGVESPGYQRVEPRDLNAFKVDFLDAIRDVEREMFSGRKPKLRSMLEEVLEEDASKTEQLESQASALVSDLKDRIDEDLLFALTQETGAEDGGEPGIDGTLREQDIIRALRLIVKGAKGGRLPATHNGLGYNNLLYISLILASLKSDKMQGGMEVVFPMLVVEEPEAHLHPALQFKLLKFIDDRIGEGGDSQQVFVTTHSTHITSATGLGATVSLSANRGGEIAASYPGHAFEAMEGGDADDSRAYVERFLDATKSSMLFARGIILVEGISEQILVPTFADSIGYSLADQHVAVVGVGGRTFKHFLPMFGAMLEDETLALDRRVACIVDADPGRRQEGGSYSNCQPYQVDHDSDEYEYRGQSGVVDTLEDYADSVANIEIFRGRKTLEYDLAACNYDTDVLVTSCCTHEEELRDLAQSGSLDGVLAGKITDAEYEALPGQDDERRAAQYATCYLSCIEGKGGHAQELNLKLRNTDDYDVPPYIREAIEWTCE